MVILVDDAIFRDYHVKQAYCGKQHEGFTVGSS
jgi:hypothetical protein